MDGKKRKRTSEKGAQRRQGAAVHETERPSARRRAPLFPIDHGDLVAAIEAMQRAESHLRFYVGPGSDERDDVRDELLAAIQLLEGLET